MNKLITRIMAALLGGALVTESAFFSPVTAFAASDESANFASQDGNIYEADEEEKGTDVSDAEETDAEKTNAENADAEASENEEAGTDKTSAENAGAEASETEEADADASDAEISDAEAAASDTEEEADNEESSEAASEETSDLIEIEEDQKGLVGEVVLISSVIGEKIQFREDGNDVIIYGSGSTYDFDDKDNSSPLSTLNKVKSITVTEGITRLGDYSVRAVNSNNGSTPSGTLKKITLPNSLKSLGNHAFASTEASAVDLVIPGSVEFMGEGAIGSTYKSVTLSEGIKTVNKRSFTYVMVSDFIKLPDSLTTIEDEAFYNARYTGSLDIPKGVKTIGSRAFYGMQKTRTGSFAGDMPEIADDAFEDTLMVMTYPANNKTWSDEKVKALSERIKNVTFVKEGTEFGTNEKCGDDITWKIDSKGVLTLTGTGDMYDYKSNDQAPWSARAGEIKSVKFSSNNITSIGDYAFCYLNITSVTTGSTAGTLPTKLTKIGDYAFTKTALEKAKIPDTITYIGDHAFDDCLKLSLQSCKFGTNLTYIGDSAFNSCYKITCTLNKLTKIEYIGNEAFSCVGTLTVTSFEFPETLTYIGDDAFWSSTSSAAKISLPASLKYLGKEAFSGCKKAVGDIVIPAGVTTVPDYAFKETAITSVVIHDNVTEIGRSAFYGCSKLKSATLGKKDKEVGEYAFINCTALATVVNMESITHFGDRSFNGCSVLTKADFGPGLTKFEYKAFGSCPKLKEYTFAGDIPKGIYTSTWEGNAASPTVNYPRYLASWIDVTAEKLGMSSLNPTLVPYGEPKYYKVVFKDDKGKDAKIINEITVELGGYVPEPEKPVREAYSFSYWKDEATDKEFRFSSTKVTSDLTLYAYWWYDGYIVNFNYLKDGTAVNKRWRYDLGDKITDPTESLLPSGYVCKGWSLTRDEDGNLGELVDFKGYTVTKDNMTFYSVFTKIHKITLVSNSYGRKFYMERQDGDPFGEIEMDATLPGMKLEGWYYESDFQTRVLDTDIVTADISIYAKWVEDETVDTDDPEAVLDEIWVSMGSDPVYKHGKAVMPSNIRVYDGKKILTLNKDYTLKAINATKVGKATLQVNFKGNYSGTLKQTYNVLPYDLESYDIMVDPIICTYNGKVQKPKPTVWLAVDGKDVKLKENRDYKVQYYDYRGYEHPFKDPGTYMVVLAGIGNFTGGYMSYETILDAVDLKKVKISGFESSKPYTGSKVYQDNLKLTYKGYELQPSKDYIVSYSSNVEAGTAQMLIMGKAMYDSISKGFDYGDLIIGLEDENKPGSGENSDELLFTGYKILSYKITGTPISKAKVEGITQNNMFAASYITMSDLKLTRTVAGSSEPEVLTGIEKGEYEKLSSDNRKAYDYTYEYVNNYKKGTAKLILRGVNGYFGSMTKTFSIKSRPLNIEGEYEVVPNYGEYTKTIGVKMKTSEKYQKGGAKPVPDIFYKYSDGNTYRLVKDKDYTVTYSSNTKVGAVGVAKIKGKGNFSGTINATFKVTEGSSSDFSVSAADVVYKNKPGACNTKVTVTDKSGKALTNKTDYTFSICYESGEPVNLKKDIVAAGTELRVIVTPAGNYTGNPVETTFRVCAANISAAKLVTGKNIYSPTNSQLYYSLTYQGRALEEGTDYTVVSTTGANAAGVVKITVKGIGNFGGTRVLSIKKAKRTVKKTGK